MTRVKKEIYKFVLSFPLFYFSFFFFFFFFHLKDMSRTDLQAEEQNENIPWTFTRNDYLFIYLIIYLLFIYLFVYLFI